jgi:hypothetical protein
MLAIQAIIRIFTTMTETLEGGFMATRQAIIPNKIDRKEFEGIKEMAFLLRNVTKEYPEVELFLPVGINEDEAQPLEAKLIRTGDITRNRRLIGHLSRQTVYRAIRSDVPSFTDAIIPVSTNYVKPGNPLHHGRDNFVTAGIDTAQLGFERQGMKTVLAGLVGIDPQELAWANRSADLKFAYCPPEVPGHVAEEIRGIIRDYLPLELVMGKGRFVPRQ